MVLGPSSGQIPVPLTGLSGWGLFCSFIWVNGSSKAGSSFATYGFSLYFSVM